MFEHRPTHCTVTVDKQAQSLPAAAAAGSLSSLSWLVDVRTDAELRIKIRPVAQIEPTNC